MLYQTLFVTLLALPQAFADGARFATIYSSDDCDAALTTSKSKAVDMSNDGCLREKGRKSFMPGKKDTEWGDFCFVTYKDGDCNCIDTSRLMHFNKYAHSVGCETKFVADHDSYHFERAVDGKCPSVGCYHDGPVDWQTKEKDDAQPAADQDEQSGTSYKGPM